MKKWMLLFCCCNLLSAKPYIKRFWKPIIFKEEKDETFNRNNLIPIEEGVYHYADKLPDAPETVETFISSGKVSLNNASFAQQELSADNVIKYLREEEEEQKHKKQRTSADNVYITLADGTENALINGGEFDSKDSNNVDGAVFAKTDITINGSGSLKVTSTAHGIVGKDDIAVTGGSITVTAEKDGIQANDSVAVQNADLYITCGKDGIQADNDKDTSKGYVYIYSGNIN